MPTIDETLKRLAISFTVRDIMVPVAGLVCAANESEAAALSSDNPDFNVIPIRRNSGRFTSYFERDTRNATKITLNNLISDGTSLLDLVQILEDREFSFVLSQRIEGYVHFSDLNNHLVKYTFYVILEALERHALNSLKRLDDRQYLMENLDEARFKQVVSRYKRAGDAARSLFNYLNISDILKLAVKAGTIQIDSGTIKAMKDTRNASAHPLEHLVSQYSDVKNLAMVRRECLRILGGT